MPFIRICVAISSTGLQYLYASGDVIIIQKKQEGVSLGQLIHQTLLFPIIL